MNQIGLAKSVIVGAVLSTTSTTRVRLTAGLPEASTA